MKKYAARRRVPACDLVDMAIPPARRIREEQATGPIAPKLWLAVGEAEPARQV
jgi:hypothetical protein